MLCAKCAYRTDAFYDFKLQVQATEKKLRKMFETQICCIKVRPKYYNSLIIHVLSGHLSLLLAVISQSSQSSLETRLM